MRLLIALVALAVAGDLVFGGPEATSAASSWGLMWSLSAEVVDRIQPHPRRQAGRAALPRRLGHPEDERADSVAAGVSLAETQSVDRLAEHLAEGAGPSRRARARAAFWYVAANVAYDLEGPSSPAAVLRTRRAACVGYSRLLVALLERMGVDAEVVGGWARSAGPGAGGHAWVAVRLDDGWYAVDPTWASSRRVGTPAPPDPVDDRWWLVPPDRMAETHQPDRRQWRLGA